MFFIKRKAAVMFAVAGFLLAAGCSSNKETETSTEEKKQLVYGMEAEIEQVNPVLDESQEIDSLLFRGLTKPTESNEIVPDLAEDWTISDDQLTYIFKMREDAKWEDGEPVTAEDVTFTLKKILDPFTNTPIGGDFSEIDSVEAMSAYEVKITLKRPFPPLLDKLKVGIVPKHLLESENINETEFNQQPVGNGPFKLKEWNPDGTITVERNEQFYSTKPKLDEVVFKPVPDANTRAVQLKTGEIDLALMEPGQASSVKEDDPYTIYDIPTADYRAVMYNLRHPLFKDPAVRQALNFGVNREDMVKGVLFNKGEAAHGPLQKSWADSPQENAYSYQPEKAAKLLEKAGWTKGEDGVLQKNGQRFEFELVSPVHDKVRVALANVVAEQLKPLGIKVIPKLMEKQSIDYTRVDSFLIGWGSEFDPDDHTYRIFHSSQVGDGLYNFGAYENTKMDELLTKARTTVDQEERKAYYEAFQKELASNPPFNFLVYLEAMYGVNKSVTGIKTRTLGHHGFGIMWNVEEWDKQ
ncbi:ABC transporter substrate-binding protein [Peribacillus saganii]|uniref:ABC transporter substrate-binding protein n=1 Tax=Peribacillus saganii TaxID=2303992 RepID=A0A372LEC4_9BACI|nr:ABC transporter substrate-binding protein [Peribacillus saganii]RFU64650.1 ABC transporter substrate-binding protein [Peribacillus saganii]